MHAFEWLDVQTKATAHEQPNYYSIGKESEVSSENFDKALFVYALVLGCAEAHIQRCKKSIVFN